MTELYGFESEEKLAQAIVAWREMEYRARRFPAIAERCRKPGSTLAWAMGQAIKIVLEPVDRLDIEAGKSAIKTWLESVA